MRDNYKVSLTILLIIVILMTIYAIADTYSVFYSETNTLMDLEIARWEIKINDQDVVHSETKTFQLDRYDIAANPNVADNRIAPGSSGNFYIDIDPNHTQVAVRFDVFIDPEELATSRTQVTGVQEISSNPDKVTIVKTAEGMYTGVFTLDQIEDEVHASLRIGFEWVNDDTKNAEDTNEGIVYGKGLNIPISIKFTQYTGEEILEYTNTTG